MLLITLSVVPAKPFTRKQPGSVHARELYGQSYFKILVSGIFWSGKGFYNLIFFGNS